MSRRGLTVAVVVVLVVALAGAGWWYTHRDGPHVLMVGDSLMYQSSQELRAQFGAHGYSLDFVGGAGTGPLDDDKRWLRDLSDQVAAHDPDVVVIEACCNYRGYTKADGTVVAPDSPEMYAEWESAANEMVRRARAFGAKVFWVITPPAQTTSAEYAAYPERIQRLNEIYRRLEGVELIDWARILAPDGVFTPTLSIPGGPPQQVRADDGLHFTTEGSQLVASATWAAVAPVLDTDR